MVGDREKILLYAQKNNLSTDRQVCIRRNGDEFGYIPLKIYDGPEIHWEVIPNILEARQIVQHRGLPNFLKARIPVATQLKPDRGARHFPLIGTSNWLT